MTMLMKARCRASSFFLLIPSRGLVLQGTEGAWVWPGGIGECYDIESGVFDVHCSVEPQFGITKNGFRCQADVRCRVHLDINRFRGNAGALEDLMLRMGAPTRYQRQPVGHEFMAGSLARGLQGQIIEILRKWEYLREPDPSRRATPTVSPHDRLIADIHRAAEKYFEDQGMVLTTFLGVTVQPLEPSAQERAANPQLNAARQEFIQAERELTRAERRTGKESELEDQELQTDPLIRARSVAIEEGRHRQQLEIDEAKEKLNIRHEYEMLNFAAQRRVTQLARRKIELAIELDSKKTEQQRLLWDYNLRQQATLAQLEHETALHAKQAETEQARTALLEARKKNQQLESELLADAIVKDAQAQAERLRAFVAGHKELIDLLLSKLPEILSKMPANAIAHPTELNVLQLGRDGAVSGTGTESGQLGDLLGTVPALVLLRQVFQFLSIGSATESLDAYAKNALPEKRS